MIRKIYITIIMGLGLFLNAQTGKVGIKTDKPTETLDVNGKTYTNSLYLRNPGEPTMTGGSFLATSENALQLYDPNLESSGLFNYLKLTLTGVSGNGIADYDTKIDANNFLVVLHNYSFKLNDGSTNVMLDYGDNGINDNKQGSPDVTAFKSNGTWHIKAKFSDSRIIATNTSTPSRTYNNFTVDLYLMAYRRLITKHNINEVNANLGGTDGSAQTINKPSGF
ncbi:hypothetical protein MP478_11815 [Chryseobacterium sp. WG14]|uniref:hypothetical protein n=1 Tax=unclassified Chryseobacterium TaxID=2593645 RepID=UPI001D5D39C4|nr:MULTISPECIES: hypothetical protein [unclassified Chryseobacterium]MCQ9634828.1 hypothetical protein [Chryseobacterium sp. WG23]MCQ9640064.1 hypothetical protein [Chryseobacterium sp. WG14]CAH0230079.1 hypothetical protein SRABI04_02708 [Chryseobacterium sp. Bi04]